MIAGNETGGTRTDAVDLQRLDGGVLDRGMMVQLEVVVTRERQQPATVTQQPNSRHAGGVDQRAASTAAFESADVGGSEFIERTHPRIGLVGSARAEWRQ